MRRVFRGAAILIAMALLVGAALVPSVSARSDARPFHGTIVGGGDVAPNLDCPIGLETLSWATGTTTHLGLTAMASVHCTPNPPFGESPGPITGGALTLTAANGDTLTASYAGTVDPVMPVEGALLGGHVVATVTGGTGRFADATGSFDMTFEGVLHFETPMVITWVLQGAIGY